MRLHDMSTHSTYRLSHIILRLTLMLFNIDYQMVASVVAK